MSTRRALAFSFLDRYSALLLSIITSMVVARLLTPAEVGVYSVSMVFVMLISAMRDLGAGQYLVQEKELSPERIRATWSVLLGMGLLMAMLALLAAHPIAEFFNEPRMVSIMWVISLNFAVSPLGSMTYAWLMREMRFDALALMRFSASIAGAIVSMLLAWQGFGPISLAYGTLAATLVNAAVSLRYRPEGFGWRMGTAQVGRVLSFGGKISATSLLSNIGNGAPEFLLGKLQGLSAAGFYSRGNGLAAMFQRLVLDATTSVAMPLLAKATRESSDIGAPLTRGISYLTALGWSFFASVALLGYPLVRLLYGDQWDESVPLMRWLVFGMAIGIPASLCPAALLATGRSGQILRATAINVGVQVLCSGYGATHGLEGAGIGFCVAQCIALPVWFRAFGNVMVLPRADLARALGTSAALAGLTSLAPLAALLWFGERPTSSLAPVLSSSIASLVLFVLGARWLRHPLHLELTWLASKLRLPRRHG